MPGVKMVSLPITQRGERQFGPAGGWIPRILVRYKGNAFKSAKANEYWEES